MKTYVAFLRGINVGGSNLLSMSELRSPCSDIGLEDVRTHIQSGNVLFESDLSEDEIVQRLETALLEKLKKRISVVVRSAQELRSILASNPFPEAGPAKVGVVLVAEPVPKNLVRDMAIPGPEEVRLGRREVYIHYPHGMGRSRLKLPKSLEEGTVRNINTIAKLVELTH